MLDLSKGAAFVFSEEVPSGASYLTITVSGMVRCGRPGGEARVEAGPDSKE
jgi:hypothetical protein